MGGSSFFEAEYRRLKLGLLNSWAPDIADSEEFFLLRGQTSKMRGSSKMGCLLRRWEVLRSSVSKNETPHRRCSKQRFG